MRDFIRLPRRIYKGNLYYVPDLDRDVKHMLSPRNAALKHAEMQAFIAYNENLDVQERKRLQEETEVLAILTGLEIDSAKSGIRPDLDEYLKERREHNQTTFRVHDNSKEMRMRRVPCEQVIEEMYAGKLEVLQNGELRYKL